MWSEGGHRYSQGTAVTVGLFLGMVAVKFGLGNFLGAVLDFLIISFVVFVIVKALVRQKPPAPLTPA